MLDIFLSAFIALFVIVDPVGMAPVFAGLVDGTPDAHKRSMAIKGSIVASVIMVFFALVGQPFLSALGISLDGLRVAGGILLFVIGFEMVMEKRSERKGESAGGMVEFFEDVSVFPVAIPLLAGPGCIATVILLMSEAHGDLGKQGMVLAAIGTVMVITLVTFVAAGRLAAFLGPTVNTVITRLLGIILCALAAQYVLDGLKGSFFG